MKTEYFCVNARRDDNNKLIKCFGDYDTFLEAQQKCNEIPYPNKEIIHVIIEEETVWSSKSGYNLNSSIIEEIE